MLATLYQLSQPKTWLWVLIPFVLGLLLSGVHPAALIHPTVIAFLVYFTLPANLLLHNPKPTGQLRLQIIAITTPFLILLVYLDPLASLVFCSFVATCIYTPKLPRLAALRYVLPLAFGFFLMGGGFGAFT